MSISPNNPPGMGTVMNETTKSLISCGVDRERAGRLAYLYAKAAAETHGHRVQVTCAILSNPHLTDGILQTQHLAPSVVALADAILEELLK